MRDALVVKVDNNYWVLRIGASRHSDNEKVNRR